MTRSQAESLVSTHGSVTAAAKAAGIARTTFRCILGSQRDDTPSAACPSAPPAPPPEPEVLSLRRENAELRRSILASTCDHGRVEGLLNRVIELIPATAVAPAVFDRREGRHKPRVDMCLHLTDLHYGANQPSDEVEGFGEFSPDICARRMTNLFRDVLDFVRVQRNGYDIRTLHILGTGDYISGDIQDLRVTNAFPAPVQAVQCAQLLTQLIAGIAPHFERVQVHLVTDDNHGRLTKKPQAKEGGLNNWSYVVGKWIEKSFASCNRVTVNVIAKPWESVECNGRRYLLTHGHHVCGWMGFPYFGIERLVAREALKRMNAPDIRKFDKVVLGHWHAPLKHPYYFIGGSVSGTDAYDHGHGRHSSPQQVSWLISEEHGEFAWTEWNLWV